MNEDEESDYCRCGMHSTCRMSWCKCECHKKEGGIK